MKDRWISGPVFNSLFDLISFFLLTNWRYSSNEVKKSKRDY